MDPNECIRQGIRAAERGDYETATQQLISYDGWLTGGGFSADEELVEKLKTLVHGIEEESLRVVSRDSDR